jgi:cyclophilin family peptidyl-prolyl cis-trans isomerase
MKLIATLCALLVLVQAPPPPFDVAQGRPFDVAQGRQRPLTLDQAQRMAQPAGAEPLVVLNAEKAWAGADILLPLVVSGSADTRAAALRAIGRLEDPHLVPRLLTLTDAPLAVLGDAIAQSLKGFDPATDPDLIALVYGWLLRIGRQPIVDPRDLGRLAPIVVPIGRIAYSTPEQVHGAEEILRKFADRTALQPELALYYGLTIRAFESLARLNTKVTTFEDDSVKRLTSILDKRSSNDKIAFTRLNALGALLATRALDADSERLALKDDDWEVRRVAMTVLAGGGAGLDDEGRVRLILEGLADVSAQVRYEAVRAYARQGAEANGCGPLESALDDQDLHVVLAALDALGDRCKADEDVTMRVTMEARAPQYVASWHRETHAFVALAKRAPDRAATSMEAFVTHPVPWVRMYAARAAAAAGDLPRLEKLAYDADDNVREAALGPLRRLKAPNAETAIAAALERPGYQLVRTAAILLSESPRDNKLVRPLMIALLRVTKEHSETSRDARLPLLDAIAIHGASDDATDVLPLLKDFDVAVAEKAAQVITQLTGKLTVAAPAPVNRGWPQAFADLQQCVVVQLASGRSFHMRMNPRGAPVTVDRFLKLATMDHYYDGLTIHRVVPNFVIQGGSPGANEYIGHREFMRDEIALNNLRGTVGLSTRGRNTADAQFFINLVANARLDYDYTVFASVFPEDMGVVDRLQEGDVMRAINPSKCAAQ